MTDDESPAENLRNAMAVLIASGEPYIGPTGTRMTYPEEAISAVKARMWKSIEQLEQEEKRRRKQPPDAVNA